MPGGHASFSFPVTPAEPGRLIAGAIVVNAPSHRFCLDLPDVSGLPPPLAVPRSGPCRSVSRRSISFRSVPLCYATSRISTSPCTTATSNFSGYAYGGSSTLLYLLTFPPSASLPVPSSLLPPPHSRTPFSGPTVRTHVTYIVTVVPKSLGLRTYVDEFIQSDRK